MRRGYEIGGKHSSDPIGSDQARGKSSYQRKSGRDDSGLTPTETHQKAQLMKQFCKLEGPSGNSEAYQTAWKRMFGRRTGEHSGDALRQIEDSIHPGFRYLCNDADCWCSPNEATTASQETP